MQKRKLEKSRLRLRGEIRMFRLDIPKRGHSFGPRLWNHHKLFRAGSPAPRRKAVDVDCACRKPNSGKSETAGSRSPSVSAAIRSGCRDNVRGQRRRPWQRCFFPWQAGRRAKWDRCWRSMDRCSGNPGARDFAPACCSMRNLPTPTLDSLYEAAAGVNFTPGLLGGKFT
jgi:hypothetical protein